MSTFESENTYLKEIVAINIFATFLVHILTNYKRKVFNMFGTQRTIRK